MSYIAFHIGLVSWLVKLVISEWYQSVKFKAKNAKPKIKTKEKVLNFELCFFTFRFKFLV